jgi:hypothetical protein
MTKERAVLPGTGVAEKEPFFMTLGVGRLAHDSSGISIEKPWWQHPTLGLAMIPYFADKERP